MLLNCGVGEDSWELLGLQGDPTSPSERKSVLNIHWKDWCWSWNSNTLATWWEELTQRRPWCWKDWRQEEKEMTEDEMASLTQWTWVWVNSGCWWWTGKPVLLQSMGHKDLDTTEWLNWLTDYPLHQSTLKPWTSEQRKFQRLWFFFVCVCHILGQFMSILTLVISCST